MRFRGLTVLLALTAAEDDYSRLTSVVSFKPETGTTNSTSIKNLSTHLSMRDDGGLLA